MIVRALIALCFVSSLGAQESACISPVGDYILAKDMARAIPTFQSAAPDRVLATAPVSGGKRIFHPDELRSIASQSGVMLESTRDVCFAWPMAPLKRSEVLAAMQRSLNRLEGLHVASIEVTDLPPEGVPAGQLDFPLSGLGSPASAEQDVPVLWRGQLLYGSTRRLAVWARVRITAPLTVVVAAERLEPRHPISAGQLRTETVQRFPFLKNTLSDIDHAAGYVPVRTIPQGAELRADSVVRPNDINRGDLITVEAHNGSVRLVFQGRAESPGRAGDLITVRNPETQKLLQARVSSKDKVIVESILDRR